MIRFALALIGWLAVVAAPTLLPAAETPTAAFTQAYQTAGQADAAFEAQNWKMAAEKYQQAIQQIEAVQTTWPGWAPERVNTRLNHCRFQARRATEYLQGTRKPWRQPAVVTPAPAQGAAAKPRPPKPARRPSPARIAQPTPQHLFDQAQSVSQAADQALELGDPASSVKQYNAAVRILRNLRFEHPNWHPERVELRLSHCLLQLRKIK